MNTNQQEPTKCPVCKTVAAPLPTSFHSWVCTNCHHEIGMDDATFKAAHKNMNQMEMLNLLKPLREPEFLSATRGKITTHYVRDRHKEFGHLALMSVGVLNRNTTRFTRLTWFSMS